MVLRSTIFFLKIFRGSRKMKDSAIIMSGALHKIKARIIGLGLPVVASVIILENNLQFMTKLPDW